MVIAKLNRPKSHKETYTYTLLIRKITNNHNNAKINLKKRKIKLTDRTLGQMVKADLNRQNHTKKHTHTHNKRRKKEKKI